MSRIELPPLYAILDPEQSRGRSAEGVLHDLIAAGAAIIQLRVKTMTPRNFLQLAKWSRAETCLHGCKLIINDRVDIAQACDADGAHLGQDDLPLAAGRKLMGQKMVGVSTHDLAQAHEAERNGADYIGFGPMFGTTTKNTGFAPRGLEMLRQIRAAVNLPIVAIGGITEQNVQQVWRAGADSAAIISDILGADDIGAKTRRILSLAPRG
jgi:thiamine-phosphate pyrophosphorylase